MSPLKLTMFHVSAEGERCGGITDATAVQAHGSTVPIAWQAFQRSCEHDTIARKRTHASPHRYGTFGCGESVHAAMLCMSEHARAALDSLAAEAANGDTGE